MSEENERMEAPVVESEELTDLDVVADALLGGDVTIETDPDLLAAEIVRRTLATPAGQVFRPEEVQHARDVLERPLKVLGVRWFPSAFESGPKVYAVLDAVILDTGEHVPVTVGGARVMAQLIVALRASSIPECLVIRQSYRPTAAGFYPLRLEECPKVEGE